VSVRGDKYLGRWILYVGGYTLRLHKFYRGDDARAPHDHPWPFWTFPLCEGGYFEQTVGEGGQLKADHVTGWRWHYRPSSYQHIVLNPPKPFYTLVVTGRKERHWGFWPQIDVCTLGTIRRMFVSWRDWK
jgi:hypothetical protein